MEQGQHPPPDNGYFCRSRGIQLRLCLLGGYSRVLSICFVGGCSEVKNCVGAIRPAVPGV